MTGALSELPSGVAEAAKLVDQIDECLATGFARLGPSQRESLEALAASFSGTPLELPINEAVASIGRNEFLTKHFVTIGAARAAIQGAQHDALVAQLVDVLGVSIPECNDPTPMNVGSAASLLSSTEQWLMELAMTGFSQLEESSITPYMVTLENLQAEKELTGLATLLTGFTSELIRCTASQSQPSPPRFRWADLWTAAMIRTHYLPGDVAFRETSGTLTPLGLTVQSHANFVSAVLYGVFDDGECTQTVRIPFSSYKVDLMVGAEVWEIFGEACSQVLTALAGSKKLMLDRAELCPTGELHLCAKPKIGKKANPFDAVESLTGIPLPPAVFRHPVHIGQVIHLQQAGDIPIATERMATSTELTPDVLDDASKMIALIRFDRGGWRAQPLCVETPDGVVISGQGIAAERKQLKSKTLAILKERSSKLLRA